MNKKLAAYLDKRSAVNPDLVTNGVPCREWQLSSGSHGYGQGYWDGEVTLAHRLSWKCHKGRLPKAKNVLHACDNRRCIEVQHLFLGTDRDNCMDKLRKGRGGYGPTHNTAVAVGIRKHGRTSISDDMARAIYFAPGSHKAVADEFNVPYPIVANIRSGRSYKLAIKETDNDGRTSATNPQPAA